MRGDSTEKQEDRPDRPADAGAGEARGFRPDVEGLRAVALGLVLAYHAGLATFSGGYVGVDVFFVISGFLITGLLLREAERTGTVSLSRFYGRRIRRLLPAAAVVVLAVCVFAVQFMPPLARRGVAEAAGAAALYATNWQQAALAVDYSAADAAASPLQHFWSLAVEEQFYLAWPLLVLAVVWWCRPRGARPAAIAADGADGADGGRALRPRLVLALGALAVVSFVHALRLSAEEGGLAYYSTFTRGWELAIGGLLALVPAAWWRRLPARVAGPLASAGLAAVAVAALRFGDATTFPAPWGLLPVLGTAAVIAAGCAVPPPPKPARATGPTAGAPRTPLVARALSLRPVRYAGRISYAWYLWHWPLVIFVPLALDRELSSRWLLVVVLAAWAPAALTHRLVEEPVRRTRRLVPVPRALALGAACTAATVLVASAAWVSTPTIALASAEQAKGAAALAEETQPQRSADALRPLPEEAMKDRGRVHDDGCLTDQRQTESDDCEYGDTEGDDTVVLFGDSHAMQYAPALEKITERRKLRLVTLTKSACTPAQVTVYNNQLQRPYRECDEWREHAMERIEEESPALIITGNQARKTVVEDGRRLSRAASDRAHERGYEKTLRALQATGAKVVTLADNPYPPEDVPSCVSGAVDKLEDCAFPESEGLAYEPVNTKATDKVDGADVIDPRPVMCQDGVCPAVIGNVIVYRNGAHITASYMETLTDWLDEELPDIG